MNGGSELVLARLGADRTWPGRIPYSIAGLGRRTGIGFQTYLP